jgi:outer membrane protein, heavy metal efflux system
MAQRTARSLGVLLGVIAATLAGCTTTNPRTALPALQSDLAARAGAAPDWPLTEGERAQSEAVVRELLGAELTPDAASRIALLNSHAVRATLEEIGISQAELAAASRLPNPTLSASVRWPDQKPRGPNTEIGVALDLLDALLIPVRKRVAAEQFEAARQRVSHEILGVVAEVKIAVLECLARQDIRARISTVLEINAAAADLGQRQFDAGNINQLELEQLKASAQQSQLELTRAEADVRFAREKINRLLGLGSAQTGWKLIASLPAIPASEPDLSDLEQTALQQRFDFAAAKTNASLAERALSLKRKTRLLPVGVKIGVDTERDSDGARVTGPNLEVGLPIFDQGQPEVARLSAISRQSKERVLALDALIRSEVRAARESLLAARVSEEYFRVVLLPQRRLILRQTLLHYNAMQKSTYELLAAKEQQQNAERGAVEALRDYWLARVELERAVGGRLPVGAAVEAAVPKESVEEPAHQHHAP